MSTAMMDRGRRRPARKAIALAAIGAVLAGCGGGATSSTSTPPTGTATGAEPAVLTVRIATNDSQAGGQSVPINELARQVELASDGRIVVTPVWEAGPPEGPPTGDYVAWDQYVARRVVDGEFEMGMIPARAWDTEGVTSMRALFAPFVVDTNELMAAVVDDEALAGDLLAGLDGTGVTGLALLPESLRHVFSFGPPLVSSSDFAGATIRAPRSITTYALFEALGAEVSDQRGADFENGVLDGSIDAAESSLDRGFSLPGGRPTAIVNITPFANINSLIANTAWLESLTDEQRDVFTEAAARTRQHMVGQLLDEAVAAVDYCATIGDVVNADDADVEAIERATAPVTAELRRDSATAALIDRILQLKAETAALPPTITPCQHRTEPTAPATGTIPLGRYTKVVTREAAEDLGVDPGFIDTEIGSDGVMPIEYELTADGRWVFRADYCGCGTMERGDFGDYAYDGDGRLVLTSRNSASDGLVTVIEWSIDGPVLSLTAPEGVDPDPIGQLFGGDLTRAT